MVIKARDDRVDRFSLMRARALPRLRRRPHVVRSLGPLDFGTFQIAAEQQARGLLLVLNGAPSRLPDSIGRGDQETERKLRARGLREKCVGVSLGDRMRRVIRLRLDRPQSTVMRLGDKVDTRIRPPSTGPVLPEPDPS